MQDPKSWQSQLNLLRWVLQTTWLPDRHATELPILWSGTCWADAADRSNGSFAACWSVSSQTCSVIGLSCLSLHNLCFCFCYNIQLPGRMHVACLASKCKTGDSSNGAALSCIARTVFFVQSACSNKHCPVPAADVYSIPSHQKSASEVQVSSWMTWRLQHCSRPSILTALIGWALQSTLRWLCFFKAHQPHLKPLINRRKALSLWISIGGYMQPPMWCKCRIFLCIVFKCLTYDTITTEGFFSSTSASWRLWMLFGKAASHLNSAHSSKHFCCLMHKSIFGVGQCYCSLHFTLFYGWHTTQHFRCLQTLFVSNNSLPYIIERKNVTECLVVLPGATIDTFVNSAFDALCLRSWSAQSISYDLTVSF